MKIAFVNQPFDVVVPPFQNSIGFYTYGVARPLARYSEVIVYGSRDVHPVTAIQECDPRLHLNLISITKTDDQVFRFRNKLGALVQISSPISTSSLLFPKYGKRVAVDLQQQQCDVIHVQHSSQYLPVIRALNPRAKIVLQIHAEWFSQSNFKELQRRLENVDLLLTVSNYITEKTKRDIPEIANRCETMYYGIDPQEFCREKDYPVERGRKEKKLLFAGVVSPQKGPHVLLDAFCIVAKQYPDVHLNLAGSLRSYPMEESFDVKDRASIRRVAPFYAKHPFTRVKAKLGFGAPDAGTYQSYLKERVPREIADKVSFLGFIGHRKDLVDLYYKADVMIFPPIWEEGFGIPPIEAMASGTPVVGTRSGALPETVKDGETGFLVEKNDPYALAQRILALLKDDDLREKMGRAARHRALTYFTWERVADLMAQRYRILCEKCA